MKKIMIFLCISVLLIGLFACGPAEPERIPDPIKATEEIETPETTETTESTETPSSAAAVKTVSMEGKEMDYVIFGKGEKTFVILPGLSIHSVMGAADAVAQAYQPFTEEYTVYLFDVTKEIKEGYTVRDMAEDTAAAMKNLGIEKADIFGASQGGMMSLYLAIDHPELVNKMILGSTLPKPNDIYVGIIETWEDLAAEKKETELLESFVDNVYSEATLEAYRDYLITSNQGVTDKEYERFLIQSEACKHFDCSDEISKIQCPVLVLGSEGDKIVTPEGSWQIAEALDCEIFMYDENFGHGVYDEAPDYKEKILDFLRK